MFPTKSNAHAASSLIHNVNIVAKIATNGHRFYAKKGPTEVDPEKVFRRGCLKG